MKMKLLILAVLLTAPAICPPAHAQKSFRTSLVNPDKDGRCSAAARKIKVAILDQHSFEPFDLEVVCEVSLWPKLIKAANLPEGTLAFTALYKKGERNSVIVISANAADNSWLSMVVRHELHHIKCRCREGD